MAYSKQTWDTTSYVNPTRMNHIEDGIASADLTSGGTINGNLNINYPSPSTSNYDSTLTLGNSTAEGTVGNSRGRLLLYSKTEYPALLYSDTLTGTRYLRLPDKSGFLATDNDIVNTSGKALEVFYQAYNITIGGNTYNDVPLCGIKITRPDDTSRYTLIGFVPGGSNLYGYVLTYSSMTLTWTQIG